MAIVREPLPADESSVSQESAGQIAVADIDIAIAENEKDGTGPAPPSSSAPVASAPPPLRPVITKEIIDTRIAALLRQVQVNRPSEDISLIRKAWEFCVQHHAGQMRASGEPYIIHPLEVAEVLAEMKMDATAIAAGLLHDSVEDPPATNEEIAA